MIARRIFLALAAGSALAVSAGICVIALAMAVYALAAPMVGPAGAWAIVAGISAALIGVIGLCLALAMSPKRPPKPKDAPAPPPATPMERLIGFVRERPIVAAAAAVTAAVLAVRNPQYLGAVIRAFTDGREPPKR